MTKKADSQLDFFVAAIQRKNPDKLKLIINGHDVTAQMPLTVAALKAEREKMQLPAGVISSREG